MTRKALALSRQMLWNTPKPRPQLVQLWRRLVIRAYLQLDMTEDARKSLLKYRQDYGALSAEFRLLQARSLLKAGKNREVIALLADDSLDAGLRAPARKRAKRKSKSGAKTGGKKKAASTAGKKRA